MIKIINWEGREYGLREECTVVGYCFWLFVTAILLIILFP